MTARTSPSNYLAAVDAVIARDASPLQSGDITHWDPIRQMLADLIETAFDAGIMRGVVLANNVITEAMLQENIVDRTNLKTNSVSSDAIIVTGAHAAGVGIRDALEALATGNRLRADRLRGELPEAQIPSVITRDTELVNFLVGLTLSTNGLNFQRQNAPSTNISLDLRPLVRRTIAAMLTGNTETGIVVTYQTDDDTIDFVVTPQGGVTPPPASHTRYAFWMPAGDTTPTVADITAGTSFTGQQVVIPAFPRGATQTRLGFGQEATEADLTVIQQVGSPFGNEFTDYTKGTVGTYEYWLSNDDRLPVTAGTTWEAY